MERGEEEFFNLRLQACMREVEQVLHVNRNPQLASEVSHRYLDKYHLAEQLVLSAVSSAFLSLELLGLDEDKLKQLRTWATERSVTLRLSARKSCAFLKEETKEEESKTKHVTEYSDNSGKTSKWTDKVVNTITTYHWRVKISYELAAFQGTQTDQSVVILAREGSEEVESLSKRSPYPENHVFDSIDLNITWLLERLRPDLSLSFSIDRSASHCHTPRRNKNIEDTLEFCKAFCSWSEEAVRFFSDKIKSDSFSRDFIHRAVAVFVPVLPLFESTVSRVESDDPPAQGLVSYPNTQQHHDCPLLSSSDMRQLLAHERIQLNERLKEVSTELPDDDTLITVTEGTAVQLFIHQCTLSMHLHCSLETLEKMLMNEVIAAIGKHVTEADFRECMQFQFRRMFKPEYAPRVFAHSIQREGLSRDGEISIELCGDNEESFPLTTINNELPPKTMSFPLDASTNIEFSGPRFVHVSLQYLFNNAAYGDSRKGKLNLEARQFCSFIALLGKITGPTTFAPETGIIVQNKDFAEFFIELETIPSAQQFRDAIESLSPEQKRFAQAFRSMQLSSSVFGILIIPLLPQLERVLNLPENSLTKEIELSQRLQELFIEYHIPSDLLSYDGDDHCSCIEKIKRVEENVAKILQMIEAEKMAIEEERIRKKLREEMITKQKEEEEKRRLEEENRRRAMEMEEARRKAMEEERLMVRRREEMDDKIMKVQEQVDMIRQQMNVNIDRVLERGERLDNLSTCADTLTAQSSFFKKQASTFKKPPMMKTERPQPSVNESCMIPEPSANVMQESIGDNKSNFSLEGDAVLMNDQRQDHTLSEQDNGGQKTGASAVELKQKQQEDKQDDQQVQQEGNQEEHQEEPQEEPQADHTHQPDTQEPADGWQLGPRLDAALAALAHVRVTAVRASGQGHVTATSLGGWRGARRPAPRLAPALALVDAVSRSGQCALYAARLHAVAACSVCVAHSAVEGVVQGLDLVGLAVDAARAVAAAMLPRHAMAL